MRERRHSGSFKVFRNDVLTQFRLVIPFLLENNGGARSFHDREQTVNRPAQGADHERTINRPWTDLHEGLCGGHSWLELEKWSHLFPNPRSFSQTLFPGSSVWAWERGPRTSAKLQGKVASQASSLHPQTEESRQESREFHRERKRGRSRKATRKLRWTEEQRGKWTNASSQPGAAWAPAIPGCGHLNEKCPHRFRYLDIWSPHWWSFGEVMDHFGNEVLPEAVCHWGQALRKQCPPPFSVFWVYFVFVFSALCFQLRISLSFLLWLHATILPWGTIMDSLSENISQNKLHSVNHLWWLYFIT